VWEPQAGGRWGSWGRRYEKQRGVTVLWMSDPHTGCWPRCVVTFWKPDSMWTATSKSRRHRLQNSIVQSIRRSERG
jgi:hypothetical protein